MARRTQRRRQYDPLTRQRSGTTPGPTFDRELGARVTDVRDPEKERMKADLAATRTALADAQRRLMAPQREDPATEQLRAARDAAVARAQELAAELEGERARHRDTGARFAPRDDSLDRLALERTERALAEEAAAHQRTKDEAAKREVSAGLRMNGINPLIADAVAATAPREFQPTPVRQDWDPTKPSPTTLGGLRPAQEPPVVLSGRPGPTRDTVEQVKRQIVELLDGLSAGL